MSCLSGPAAVADRVSLSTVHDEWKLDNHTMSLDVPPMWISSLRYGGNDLPSNANPSTRLVSSYVVDDGPEAQAQRLGSPAPAGPWQLQNGVVVAAETATRDGAAWPGPSGGSG